MTDKEWAARLALLETRSEVRDFIAAALEDLLRSGHGLSGFPAAVVGLSTGSDREVLESYRHVSDFCAGRSVSSRRLSGTAIGSRVRDLFGMALNRMKKLPAEPLKVAPIVSAPQVRRG
jgi:hypothetical protein